jgi:hypothetical protein
MKSCAICEFCESMGVSVAWRQRSSLRHDTGSCCNLRVHAHIWTKLYVLDNSRGHLLCYWWTSQTGELLLCLQTSTILPLTQSDGFLQCAEVFNNSEDNTTSHVFLLFSRRRSDRQCFQFAACMDTELRYREKHTVSWLQLNLECTRIQFCMVNSVLTEQSELTGRVRDFFCLFLSLQRRMLQSESSLKRAMKSQ